VTNTNYKETLIHLKHLYPKNHFKNLMFLFLNFNYSHYSTFYQYKYLSKETSLINHYSYFLSNSKSLPNSAFFCYYPNLNNLKVIPIINLNYFNFNFKFNLLRLVLSHFHFNSPFYLILNFYSKYCYLKVGCT
jgi:hypothetical protein